MARFHVSGFTAARGRLTNTPGSVSDTLNLIVEAYSAAYHFEVPAGQWGAQNGVLPVEGTECLVIIDNERDAWVPRWIDA